MARPENSSPARRRFLRDAVRAVAGLSAAVTVLGIQQRRAQADVLRLRPPGALSEAAFSGACIRCGQCVQACPYDTLKLATLVSGSAAGSPYFVARLQPLSAIDDARMGLAVLLDQENCLNYQGLRCDVCYRVCPLIDSAITLEPERNARTGKHARFLPTVHSDVCTGCGKCEKACVLEQPAIKVLPRALAKGELGHHYRFSWLEARDGKS
ncbi:4Fe-4S dicluster domain-containing protein [Pectobacterium carotovorum]|uniref:4Fe-4S dicluster domain-containing protein n=1 Tax=Pectobacterium carotovorum TaxID=554 RepID=UPI00193E4FE1|nr:4Fe-4S dicluster domain-containing protein [Pectobacterium carotovorum]QRN39980.1 4Fe-4S dicluster domain-containing protein [Pectobacterium carotovorum]